MNQVRKILVLLDGSERSRQTLAYLVKLPFFHDREVVLYQVYNEMPQFCRDLDIPFHASALSRPFSDWGTNEIDRLHAFMEQARTDLIGAGFHPERVRVFLQKEKQGEPQDILREAKRDYDAVVLQRRGRGRVKGIVVGSVAGKVLAGLSRTPVILAGKSPPTPKVLLAVDGSLASFQAARFVCELAGEAGCSVFLLHVIRSHKLSIMPSEMLDGHKKRMRQTFAKLTALFINAGIQPDNISEEIIAGTPSRANTIVQEAVSRGMSTVALGRRGLSRQQDESMGQVCQKVIYSGRELSLWIV